MKKLTAYLTCDKFTKDINDALADRYKCTLYKDVAFLELDEDQEIVLFAYGAIVMWNVDYENTKFFLDFVQGYEIESFEEEIVEQLGYMVAENFKIVNDTLYMTNEDVLTKIAVSHALAQNTKLEQFESYVAQSIEQNSAIPQQLALKGKIEMNKKEIAKKIGELFLVKSKINLHYDLLDTPEFFWEYPECEVYYESVIKYLDIKPRVEVLNKKVEVTQELLDVLADEQKHRYSSFLEWIIIILIGFEIIMGLYELF